MTSVGLTVAKWATVTLKIRRTWRSRTPAQPWASEAESGWKWAAAQTLNMAWSAKLPTVRDIWNAVDSIRHQMWHNLLQRFPLIFFHLLYFSLSRACGDGQSQWVSLSILSTIFVHKFVHFLQPYLLSELATLLVLMTFAVAKRLSWWLSS